MRTTTAVLMMLGLLSGCDVFYGTVQGKGMSAKESFYFLLTDPQGTIMGADVVLSDHKGMCAELQANKQPRSWTYLNLEVRRISNDHYVAPGTGEYEIWYYNDLPSAGDVASGRFYRTDLNCAQTIAPVNSAVVYGTVKVNELGVGPQAKMTGSFDITIGDQHDHGSGSFNATWCDVRTVGGQRCE